MRIYLNEKNTFAQRKKLNPLGKQFSQLYLDPFMEPAAICKLMNISMASYYRYVQELNFPTIRVSITNTCEQPFKKVLANPILDTQKRDLQIIRKIALNLDVKAKFKLIPSENPGLELKNGHADIAIGGISWTRERAQHFYHSDTYEFKNLPHGYLFKRINEFPLQVSSKKTKPVLAVLKNSVHSEYAYQNLQNEFQIREFVTYMTTLRALTSRQADRVLMHSSALQLNTDIEIASSRFSYDTFTTILFHRDSQALIKPVNQALELIFEKTNLEPTA